MNPWTKFAQLIAPGAKQIVTVTTVGSDGTSVVTLRNGSSMRVAGDTVATGQKAFIQNGRIIGRAPDLPVQNVEV